MLHKRTHDQWLYLSCSHYCHKTEVSLYFLVNYFCRLLTIYISLYIQQRPTYFRLHLVYLNPYLSFFLFFDNANKHSRDVSSVACYRLTSKISEIFTFCLQITLLTPRFYLYLQHDSGLLFLLWYALNSFYFDFFSFSLFFLLFSFLDNEEIYNYSCYDLKSLELDKRTTFILE